MSRIQLLWGCLLLTLTAACRHESDLNNVPIVHFGTEIQAILSGNCTMSGCHDGHGEFSLVGYDNVISNGGVKAYNAHGSKLYNSVTGREWEIMPPSSYPALTNKQLQQIYVWIEQGALDN